MHWGAFSLRSAPCFFMRYWARTVWCAGCGWWPGPFSGVACSKEPVGYGQFGDESPRFRWYHVLILVVLLVAAFCLRVYRLYDIPLDLSTDMATVGISVRDYLLGAEQNIFAPPTTPA